MSSDDKPSAADLLMFLKSKGFSQDAVVRFKEQAKSRRLTSKQVERALMANRRDKLKTICHHVATTGQAHLYLSVMGDKVVLTGIEQLKLNQKPFNKRGFGSAKHPLKPHEAARVKKSYLQRLAPEERRELARKGGLAAAQKRKHKEEMRAKRGPHWTQKPENRARLNSILAKMTAVSKAKRTAAGS